MHTEKKDDDPKQIITAIIAIIALFTSRYIYQPIINRLLITVEVALDTEYILSMIITILAVNYDVDDKRMIDLKLG